MLQNEFKVQMLKTQNRHFIDVADGKKKCEIRVNDRSFKEDEYLMLGCYDGEMYQNRFMICKITHIISDFIGLQDNYVMLSIEKMTGVVYDDYGIFEQYHE